MKKHPDGCFLNSYGEGEIRTLDTVSRMQSFQDCALNRSATSPRKRCVGLISSIIIPNS